MVLSMSMKKLVLAIVTLLAISGGVLFSAANSGTMPVDTEPQVQAQQTENPKTDFFDSYTSNPPAPVVVPNNPVSTPSVASATTPVPVSPLAPPQTYELPPVDRSAYIAACNASKQAKLDYNAAKVNAELSNHSNRLYNIAADFSSRGLLHSGLHQAAIQAENQRHENALALLAAEKASIIAIICA